MTHPIISQFWIKLFKDLISTSMSRIRLDGLDYPALWATSTERCATQAGIIFQRSQNFCKLPASRPFSPSPFFLPPFPSSQISKSSSCNTISQSPTVKKFPSFICSTNSILAIPLFLSQFDELTKINHKHKLLEKEIRLSYTSSSCRKLKFRRIWGGANK